MKKPLIPTKDMVDAGVKELAGMMSVGDMEVDELSDVVVFVWQAMYCMHDLNGSRKVLGEE